MDDHHKEYIRFINKVNDLNESLMNIDGALKYSDIEASKISLTRSFVNKNIFILVHELFLPITKAFIESYIRTSILNNENNKLLFYNEFKDELGDISISIKSFFEGRSNEEFENKLICEMTKTKNISVYVRRLKYFVPDIDPLLMDDLEFFSCLRNRMVHNNGHITESWKRKYWNSIEKNGITVKKKKGKDNIYVSGNYKNIKTCIDLYVSIAEKMNNIKFD